MNKNKLRLRFRVSYLILEIKEDYDVYVLKNYWNLLTIFTQI